MQEPSNQQTSTSGEASVNPSMTQAAERGLALGRAGAGRAALTPACTLPAPHASEFTGRCRTIQRQAQVTDVKHLICNLCVPFQDRSSISKDVTLNPSYPLRLEQWQPNLESSRGLKGNRSNGLPLCDTPSNIRKMKLQI